MSNILVVMPAYNAESTLMETIKNLPKICDKVLICDDASNDKTVDVGRSLGLKMIEHNINRGYGANQKSLYDNSIISKAKIVVMVHPDNQYNTDCIPEMIKCIENGADLVLGSRMETARQNGMPWWKFLSNRLLSTIQNQIYGQHMSEYHSGLRAYNIKLLQMMPYNKFSNDFVFDSQVIAWTIANDFHIDEVKTNCYYSEDASSVGVRASLRYGFATMGVLWKFKRGYFLHQK
ncbi:MAG TPA: glycosyltransferase family 2 protein [Patescibacteria group bacterium]|nr:glycosyltransferase family 2 protein [Patescibacteria group bacterium]